MSIRLKVLSAIGITFIALFIALYAISQSVILDSYTQLEEDAARANITRVQNVLQDGIATQLFGNGDWAIWTDSYEFVQGDLPEYPDDNLSSDALITLNLNMMLFLNNEGETFFAKVVDLDSGDDIEIPAGLENYFNDENLLISQADFEAGNDGAGGFVRTGDGLMQVTSRAILTSEGEGPVAGTLVMGRFLDEAQIAALSESLQLDIEVFPYTADDLPDNVEAIKPALSSDAPLRVDVLDDETIVGYAFMQDIEGEPISITTATMSRDIYAQGLQTINLLAILLLITGIVLSIVMVIALELVVIRRTTRLAEEVDDIQEHEEASSLVTVNSSDEVTNLSENINSMITRIRQSRQQLEANNAELKLAYEQAEEATRMKSQFLSTMSHELRTPLNAVIGYSGIIMEGIGGEVDDDAMQMITHIKTSSEHLLKLINSVLDISKVEAGHLELVPEPFSVRMLALTLKEQMQVLATNKKIGFNVTIDDKMPLVLEGDKDRITQILMNLVSNAFKFTDQGQVDLTFDWDDKVIINVKDTGKGIAPHALQYIFDEFRQENETTQRTHGGTGLGLAISRKLAQLMGGTITVESTLGDGTTFTVILPLKVVHNMTDSQQMEIV